MKKILVLLLLIVAGLFFVWKKVPFVQTVFDKQPPEVTIADPVAIDGKPSLTVTAVCPTSGVNKVTITATQGEKKKKVLLDTEISPKELTHTVTVPLPTTADGFVDGNVEIQVAAYSAGFWSAKGSASRQILVDTHPPKLEVLSSQYEVKIGGAEMALMRAKDENLTNVGVRVGTLIFPAVKLADIDPSFKTQPDLYGALFALPFSFESDHGKVEAFAQDAANNERAVRLSFHVARARHADVNPKLTLDFLHRKMAELLPGYAAMSGATVPTETQIDAETPDELIANFRTVNEQYRKLLNDKLKTFLYEKITPKQWEGDFIRPVSGSTTSIFGEERAYSFNGVPAGSSTHYGLDLASTANDSVKAVNAGTVLMAADFGIYGQAVLIDHGLGLASLYGHLSALSVEAGDTVKRGQEVGRTGQTGLAGGDHLHFEFRVNDIPVTPIEWWDPKWIRDHVLGKLEGLKTALSAAGGTTP